MVGRWHGLGMEAGEHYLKVLTSQAPGGSDSGVDLDREPPALLVWKVPGLDAEALGQGEDAIIDARRTDGAVRDAMGEAAQEVVEGHRRDDDTGTPPP